MIEITVKTEADRRYRCLVSLQRTDRPRYWTFHCPNCTMPLCEIVNAEVVDMRDLINFQNQDIIANGIRCDGRTGHGRCNIYFYFNLNPA